MAAFERIRSGIEQMDKCLDNIRLGDNVVWRVSKLEEFKYFMEPYVEQAKKDGRNIIYFRFASHEPLIDECPEVKTINVSLSHRFETFTVEIHNIIEEEGRDAFYVFDCLSELQAAWATDLMMGNFFRVTCPFLFSLDTVAFFPVTRGHHSHSAIQKIMDTTQLFLDVYSDESHIYVRPQKMWRRDSPTMFLPHIYDPATGEFAPILDGVLSSRFYKTLDAVQRPGGEQYMDSWDRFFNKVRIMYENGLNVDEECSQMCEIMMTRDSKMHEMVKKHFSTEDYFYVRDHMIGTGLIGGKACGMLTARKIIQNKRPDIFSILEPHDSYFIGSDVYYSFIVENDFWDLRIRQRTEQEYFDLADEFADHLRNGRFSDDMERQFMHILEYYGQDPYIVRSSSILEDGFGNAFAGKYESVFCANRGTLEERLIEFEKAVKEVYASSMSMSALDYRKRRGLDKNDEQMALLVMRVSGSYYDNLYMPCAAGVGYSYSPYKFVKNIDMNAGMLRLVMGLGTSAVDRTEGSYPRLVSLDNPNATSLTTVKEKHEFSQKKIEVIDMSARCLRKLELDELIPKLPQYLQNKLLDHDYELEAHLRELGRWRNIQFISCRALTSNPELMSQMQQMMHTIQEEYEYPVDIEFTINLSPDGDYLINLLQCRPLQVFKDTGKVNIPQNIDPEQVLLESVHASMGLSRHVKLDMIVMVDPVGYYNMPYQNKSKIANAIGKINWAFRGQNKHMMLFAPGRIGTSSPELGVPTAFSYISEFEAICEIADSRAGYNPELSYGSHIFQDLVEAQILYTAVFENEQTIHYRPEMLNKCDNLIEQFEGCSELADIIKLYDVSQLHCDLFNDLADERLLITLAYPFE